MPTYFWLCGLTFILSLTLTPPAIKAARKFNILDVPDARKIHTDHTPRGGGLVFSTVWLAAVTGLYFSGHFNAAHGRLILGLLSGSGFITIVGLADDWRGLRSVPKLLLQVAAAVIFLAIAQPVLQMNLLFFFASVAWIVLVTNSFNLIDGLDGLAVGLAVVAAVSFAVMSLLSDQPLVFLLSLALLGACLGFLPYNWRPAKVFMGDAGSHFLGFVIAALGLISIRSGSRIDSFLVPVLFVAVPLFDTFLSIIRRIMHKKPLFAADKSHFYNLLMNRGFSHRGSVLFCYALAVLFSAVSAGLIFAGGLLLAGAVLGIAAATLVTLTVRLRLLAAD